MTSSIATTRRKLTPELIPRARELAALGLPLVAIAEACGVHRATIHRWRTEAGPEGLERDLCNAIHEGHRQGEEALVQSLFAAADRGDTRAAQWLLTHARAWRNNWSDAAALRRELNALLKEVVEAIRACDALTPDQRHRLFLTMQARGIGEEPDAE